MKFGGQIQYSTVQYSTVQYNSIYLIAEAELDFPVGAGVPGPELGADPWDPIGAWPPPDTPEASLEREEEELNTGFKPGLLWAEFNPWKDPEEPGLDPKGPGLDPKCPGFDPKGLWPRPRDPWPIKLVWGRREELRELFKGLENPRGLDRVEILVVSPGPRGLVGSPGTIGGKTGLFKDGWKPPKERNFHFTKFKKFKL